jgi:hypothetical protein
MTNGVSAITNGIQSASSGNWGLGWDMVSALATVGATVAIAIAIRQFRFEAWLRAEELIRSFHEDRAKVFSRLPSCTGSWSPEEKAHALEVCRKMNTVAYLLRFLPRREALEHWDDPLAKAWVVLKPIVDEERVRTHWKSKWRHFEIWGERALDRLVGEGRDPRKSDKSQNG